LFADWTIENFKPVTPLVRVDSIVHTHEGKKNGGVESKGIVGLEEMLFWLMFADIL
jgi:hypothetical protein